MGAGNKTIGNLQVVLDAKIAPFKKQMNAAKKEAARYSRVIDQAVNKGSETTGKGVSGKQAEEMEKVNKILQNVQKSTEAVNSTFKKLQDQIEHCTESMERYNQQSENSQPATENSQSFEDSSGLGTKFSVGNLGSEKMANMLGRVKEKLQSIMEPAQKVNERVQKIVQLIPKIGSVASEASQLARKGFSMMASAAKTAYAGIQKVSGVAAALIQKFSTGIPVIGKLSSALVNLGRQGNQSTGGIDNLRNSLGRLKGIIAGVLSVAAVVNFGKSCLELGSDLQEVQNVVEVTFPNMTEAVNEFAQNAATQFGLSETMAKRYTGTFGAMARAFGFAENEALNMSTRLTGLAGDVASFYNITQDEAYTKLKSVFTGETESLKDLGVVMTQNALDAYALANGYGKTTQNMSEMEKVALRYAFVQEKLSAASEDFIRTQDSWANQIRILSLQFDSLKATIGQGMINLLTPVVKVINLIISKVSTLANAFKAFTELITGGSASAGSGVGEVASETASITSGMEDAASAANNLADATGNAGNAAAKAAKQALGLLAFDEINKLTDNSSSESDSGSGTGSGTGTGDLSGDSVDYGKLAETTEETNALGKAMADAIQVFKDAWDAKGQLVMDSWQGALESVKTLAADVGITFLDVWNDGSGYQYCTNILDIVADLGQAVDVFAKAFKTAWDDNNTGYNYIESIFNKWNALLELIHVIDQSVISVWDNGTGSDILGNWLQTCTNINNAVGNLADRFKDAWTEADTGTSIIQNICNIVNDIYQYLNESTGEFEKWTTTVDFSSLLQELNEALESIQNGDYSNLGTSIGDGISGVLNVLDNFINWDGFKNTCSNIIESVCNTLSGAVLGTDWELLGKTLSDAFKTALGWISKAVLETNWMSVGTAIADFLCGIDWIGLLAGVGKIILSAIVAAVELSLGLVLQLGTNIIEGLLKGIADAVVGIGTWIKTNVIDPFIDSVKELFGIHSPSTVMAEIGGYLIEGLLDGILAPFKNIESWIKKNIINPFVESFNKLFGNENTNEQNVTIGVGLKKNGWSTISKWIGNIPVLSQLIKLGKSGWSKVSSWIGNIPVLSQGLKLAKSGWKTISSWIGKVPTLSAKISLAKKSWSTVKKWLGVDKDFSLGFKLPKIKVNWGSKTVAGFTIKYPNGFSTYATGGFPKMGEMFIANEAGPEMIGKLGNKTTVANNQQIAEGIAAAVEPAVYNAMIAAMRQSGDGKNINIILQGDAKKFFKAMQSEAQQYTKTHGTSAFPV